MKKASMSGGTTGTESLETDFHRGLGLFDATMVVMGSMIGSGIFLVSAEMSRLIGSPGWLLMAWVVTGVLTVTAAVSYGELAALLPHAGGQYVYLREAFSPLCGFLYGWTLFLVIQTGTIAAVAVAFARFAGALVPGIAEDRYIVEPIHLASGYAVSLSTAQLVGVALIALLTVTNMRGLEWGKWIQNLFTVTKTGALAALILLGVWWGWGSESWSTNRAVFWTPTETDFLAPGLSAATGFGLFAALCVSQTGSLFSSDAWNNITFAAAEVREPRRTLPLALALGTSAVIGLYLAANFAYLVVLPFADIQHAPADRVATAMLDRLIPGGVAAPLMAVAIMISTFGCNNGLILSGARAYFAMARDGLFFRPAARLNAARVPAWGLLLQGVWASLLVLPRTYRDGKYGNLYGDLLDYVISAALLFYVLTILGIFRLRAKRPLEARSYRAVGYPWVPLIYIAGATTIMAVLLVYRPMTTWPGFALVALGLPVYFLWSKRG